MTATNAIGTGTASAASNAATPLQLPVVVINAAVATNNAGEISVTLSTNCPTACTPITNYTVTATQAGGGQAFNANGANSPVVVTADPQFNGQYNIVATGTNAVGTGANSATFTYFTP